jgi:hypothetical protein
MYSCSSHKQRRLSSGTREGTHPRPRSDRHGAHGQWLSTSCAQNGGMNQRNSGPRRSLARGLRSAQPARARRARAAGEGRRVPVGNKGQRPTMWCRQAAPGAEVLDEQHGSEFALEMKAVQQGPFRDGDFRRAHPLRQSGSTSPRRGRATCPAADADAPCRRQYPLPSTVSLSSVSGAWSGKWRASSRAPVETLGQFREDLGSACVAKSPPHSI